MSEPNGRRSAVIWVGGILLTGTLSASGTWVFNYIKEAHDAATKTDQSAILLQDIKLRLERMEAWRVEISQLAAERGKEIPRIQRDVEEIKQELKAARERRG